MGKNKNGIPERDINTLGLISRNRRNRKSEAVRDLARETYLLPGDLIYPLFIHDKPDTEEIDSMPGCRRFGKDGLLREIESSLEQGIGSFILFPAVNESLKSGLCEESYNSKGLVQNYLNAAKKSFPEANLITDVALDPYSSEGHDGIVSPSGEILNDFTVDILCKQALSHARAGADMVAPSDMMDGRVGAIREMLDEEGFTNVSILSYTAKYASAFYGPFRGALQSAPKSGDKKTYQMDPANSRESIRALEQDEAEGADMVMVKPASHYLDLIRMFRDNTNLPVAAYQVSGEYLMIKAASQSGWLDEEQVITESLTCIKRAGADMILTYFAPKAARLLNKNR